MPWPHLPWPHLTPDEIRNSLSPPAVLRAVLDAGHEVFATPGYDLNIVGVRSPSRRDLSFNDDLYVAWLSHGGGRPASVPFWWNVLRFPCTTDPGAYWLQNPGRVAGTAILAPGQYRGVWKMGLHKGRPAFEQVGTFRVYRDADRDLELDMQADRIEDAGPECGIDLHDAGSVSTSGAPVGKWSAGCQVAFVADVGVLLALGRQQVEVHGWDTFSYTLLDGPLPE